MDIPMNLIRTAALAFTGAMLLPTMAAAETDCASYLHRGDAVMTEEAFDACMDAGAWDLDEMRTREGLLYLAVTRGADRSVFEHMMREEVGAPQTGLMAALEIADADLIDWFAEQGADMSSSETLGATPLSFAMMHYRDDPALSLELATQLLDLGADPNVFYDDFGWTSVMHRAAAVGTDFLDLMLAHGGDINLPMVGKHSKEIAKGMTPLHFALAGGDDVATIQHLLDKGADPLVPAANGLRPVDMDAVEDAKPDPEAIAVVRAAAGIDASSEIKSEGWFKAYCQSELPDVDRRHLEDDPLGVDGFCECVAEEAVLISEIWIERGRVEPNSKGYDQMNEYAFGGGAMICGIRYGE